MQLAELSGLERAPHISRHLASRLSDLKGFNITLDRDLCAVGELTDRGEVHAFFIEGDDRVELAFVEAWLSEEAVGAHDVVGHESHNTSSLEGQTHASA